MLSHGLLYPHGHAAWRGFVFREIVCFAEDSPSGLAPGRTRPWNREIPQYCFCLNRPYTSLSLCREWHKPCGKNRSPSAYSFCICRGSYFPWPDLGTIFQKIKGVCRVVRECSVHVYSHYSKGWKNDHPACQNSLPIDRHDGENIKVDIAIRSTAIGKQKTSVEDKALCLPMRDQGRGERAIRLKLAGAEGLEPG